MLQQILDTLARAVATYGRRNMRIMYDALGTLAEAVGQALAEPMFLHIIMPPLIAKWQSVADTDQELLPLLECFMVIAKALGMLYDMALSSVTQACFRSGLVFEVHNVQLLMRAHCLQARRFTSLQSRFLNGAIGLRQIS